MLLAASAAGAGNWPQWRGPAFNGSTPETGLPGTFSPTENVTWSADLPGIGGSTPIVWDDCVFVTAQEPQSQKLWALSLNRADGSVRWRKPMGKGFRNRYGNTGASPSPITDGETVWFYFGTGELAAFDFAGKEIWRRNISRDHGPFEILWDYGSTGLLHGGKLYIPVIHGPLRAGGPRGGRRRGGGRAESDAGGAVDLTRTGFLLCVDPATGKDLWKRTRPSAAFFEAKQAYTTPAPHTLGGRDVILLKGADYVTAHEAATGEELWRSPSYNPRNDRNYRTIVSPVAAGAMAIVCPPRGAQRIYGAVIGRDSKDWAWSIRFPSPDVPTPLVYGGKVFVLAGGRKKMLCLDPETGRTIWQGDLGGKAVFQASPTGADGRIYCINMKGEAVVLSAGESFRVLHRVNMGGADCRSTITAADGQLFLRTDTKLFCIGTRRK
jgi:outer membrane protein assembly factor BamB